MTATRNIIASFIPTDVPGYPAVEVWNDVDEKHLIYGQANAYRFPVVGWVVVHCHEYSDGPPTSSRVELAILDGDHRVYPLSEYTGDNLSCEWRTRSITREELDAR